MPPQLGRRRREARPAARVLGRSLPRCMMGGTEGGANGDGQTIMHRLHNSSGGASGGGGLSAPGGCSRGPACDPLAVRCETSDGQSVEAQVGRRRT